MPFDDLELDAQADQAADKTSPTSTMEPKVDGTIASTEPIAAHQEEMPPPTTVPKRRRCNPGSSIAPSSVDLLEEEAWRLLLIAPGLKLVGCSTIVACHRPP